MIYMIIGIFVACFALKKANPNYLELEECFLVVNIFIGIVAVWPIVLVAWLLNEISLICRKG